MRAMPKEKRHVYLEGAVPLENYPMLANCNEISLSGNSMLEFLAGYFFNWLNDGILFNPLMKRFISR